MPQSTLGLGPNETEKEMTSEELRKYEDEHNPFFKPETNIEYTLSFSKVWQGIKKVQKFDKNQPVAGEFEEVAMLTLTLDSLNGKPSAKTWDILSWGLRKLFAPYIDKGLATKRQFSFKRTGEGPKTQYELIALDDKPPSGASSTPSFTASQKVDPAKLAADYFPQEATPAEKARMMRVNVRKLPGELQHFEAVGDDLKTYDIWKGNNELPEGLAQILINRGYAEQTIPIDFSKGL